MFGLNRRHMLDTGLIAITALAAASKGVRAATHEGTPMLQALKAEGPNEALAPKLRLYGQFVGSWDLDVTYRDPTGVMHEAGAEWHFDWVLDGRAIQDVWIFPARKLRQDKPEPWFFYGSTLRVYDPGIDAWHITYVEPTRPFVLRQIGRATGADIVQLADEQNGVIRRWSFVEITKRSFRWLGDASRDKGASWTLEMEMRARRAA